jgi:hypothetical protein
MGLVLITAIVCAVVRVSSVALMLSLLLLAFFNVFLFGLYVFGIFRLGRWGLHAIKRRSRATGFGSQEMVPSTLRE